MSHTFHPCHVRNCTREAHGGQRHEAMVPCRACGGYNMHFVTHTGIVDPEPEIGSGTCTCDLD